MIELLLITFLLLIAFLIAGIGYFVGGHRGAVSCLGQAGACLLIAVLLLLALLFLFFGLVLVGASGV